MTAIDINSGTENKAPAIAGSSAGIKGFPPEYTARLAASPLNPFANDGAASTEFMRAAITGENPSVSDMLRAYVGEEIKGDIHQFTGIASSGTQIELAAAAPGDEIKLAGGQDALIQNMIAKDGRVLGVTALRVNGETGKLSAGYFSADKIEGVTRLDAGKPVITGNPNLRCTAIEKDRLDQYKQAAEAVAEKYGMEKESAAYLCLSTDTRDPKDLSKVDKMASEFKGSKFVGPMNDAQTLYALAKMGCFGADQVSVQDGKFATTVTVGAGNEKETQRLVDRYKNDPAFQVIAHAATGAWNVKPIMKTAPAPEAGLAQDGMENSNKKPILSAPKL